jgi:hypothetical protein
MVGRVIARGSLVLAGVALLSVACGDPGSSTTTASGTGGGGSSGTGGGSSGSTQPLLVIVDTNQTMTASPGQGVGVFVEYQAGGHWNIWWTCDTYKTSLSCNFDVIATVTTGTIANVIGQSETVNQASSQQIEALSTTTTGVNGMTFDTPLGPKAPIITVSASVDGAQSGSFLFFVQNGQINGGYNGTLSDPLMFEPSSP